MILRTALGMALSQLAAETFDFHSTCRRAKSGACRFPFDYCEYSLTKERYTTIAHTYIYTYTGIPYTYRIRPPHESARPRFLARAFIFFVAKSFETTLPFSTQRASLCTTAGKTKKSNSSVSRVAAARTRPEGEKRRQSSVRGCSFPQRTLYAFYVVVFRRVYF